MNLALVAGEIDARLKKLPRLVTTYLGQGIKSVTTPCAVTPLPDINYQQAYSSTLVRVPDWEIAILAGKIDDSTAFQRLGEFASTSGPNSVHAALQASAGPIFSAYTACDFVVVKSVTFDLITWQDQDFQGALFTIDVVGR